MKIERNEPPREFAVGNEPRINMRDCGSVHLSADEQITLKTEAGGEYDVARKNWGFYATPSVNGRLKRFGFRTALVKNRLGQFYVMLIENGHESEFDSYLQREGMTVTEWLSDLDSSTENDAA